MSRCFGDGDPLYERYHDEEWGRPVTDERGLFERMSLEAFQSGLSWVTILRKREHFRAAFADFEPEAVARFGDDEQDRRSRVVADHRGQRGVGLPGQGQRDEDQRARADVNVPDGTGRLGGAYVGGDGAGQRR